jgi:hypothetical protein
MEISKGQKSGEEVQLILRFLSYTHSQASWTLQTCIFQTWTSQMCTHGGVYLVDVHPMRIHFTGMHLIGMYLTGVHPMGMYLINVYLTGVSDRLEPGDYAFSQHP